MTTPTTAKDIGPYRILEELGSGGMGTVYRAEVVGRAPGLAAGTVVALKVVHAHLLRREGFFKRFLREGEIGKRIRHPNVVATYDLDGMKLGDETILYLAMEYVVGQTLESLLAELGPLPEDLCRHIAKEAAQGLAAVHALGVVHRDVKPENILVTKDHDIKVMDLGVARLVDARTRLSEAGQFIGSVLYASPEQVTKDDREVDARADLHALGLVIYELATGKHPFLAEAAAQVVHRILNESAPRLSELDPRVSNFFDEVVHTLLAKDPDERFSSAAELADVLGEGERSAWWKSRMKGSRTRGRRPTRVPTVWETPIVGRDREMASLGAALESARKGEGRIVLVEGEAGIGKTRLVSEFAAQVAERGDPVSVLVGGFPPGGAATAWSAFATAFVSFFGEDELEESLKKRLPDTPHLAAAFTALLRGEPTPTGAEPLTKESLQTVFVRTLRSIAETSTVLLCIEDLHCAPPAALALFAAVALGAPGHRILVVGTARGGLPEEWTSGLSRLAPTVRVDLARLGLKDLARLLIAAVGSERLADEIGFPLVTKSDGNPFFVFEILRNLRERGILVRGEKGQWRATQPIRDIAIPSSLQEVVGSRIAILTDADRDLLEVASCCGFEFDPRILEAAMKLDRVEVLKRLAGIERRHRLVHMMGDRCVFDHHEVRAALRAGIPDVLAREYHAAIADALLHRNPVASGAAAVEISEHLIAGDGGARALPFVRAALLHLDQSCAGDLAADLTSRVLASPGIAVGDERIALLLGQAERLDLLGRREEERNVLAELRHLAESSADRGLAARVRLGAARCCRQIALYEDAVLLVGEARELAAAVGDAGTEAAAIGLLGDVQRELGRYDAARASHELEIELRRGSGDRPGEAAATGKLGTVFHILGRHEQAYALFQREAALSREADSRLANGLVKHNLGCALAALGHYDDARAHFADSLSVTRLVGFRRGEAAALIELGDAFLMLGDLEASSRHLHAAAQLCSETRVRYLLGKTLCSLAEHAMATGRASKAFRRAQRAARLRRSIGDRPGLVTSLLQLGRLRKVTGAVPFARKAFEEARTIASDLALRGEETLAIVHLAALRGADIAAAIASLTAYEDRLRVADRMETRSLLWSATGDPVHLVEAKRLLDQVVEHTPPERRHALVANVSQHRAVAASRALPASFARAS